MKILLLVIACVAIMGYLVAQPLFKPITTTASWYGRGDGLAGKLTASGEVFNPDDMTCAFWGLPFGTRLKVSVGSRWIIVRVNDRGPNRKKYPDRGIDLSRAAFAKLADPDKGLIRVKIELLKSKKIPGH